MSEWGDPGGRRPAPVVPDGEDAPTEVVGVVDTPLGPPVGGRTLESYPVDVPGARPEVEGVGVSDDQPTVIEVPLTLGAGRPRGPTVQPGATSRRLLGPLPPLLPGVTI